MFDKRRSSPRARAEAFADRLSIRLPVLLAPMAGACPPALSIAVANAGGLGACGALMMKPEEITAWSAEFRRSSQGEFQLNLWISRHAAGARLGAGKTAARISCNVGTFCSTGSGRCGAAGL